MHETADDLAALQALIDRSYAGAGEHLLRIHTPDRRVDGNELVERLQGMCLLVLATTSADGRPIAGPVDGIFLRGHFYFGSAPDSVRLRHIAKRPDVSATHIPAEEFAVTVHGRAVPVDLKQEAGGEFRQTLIDIYVPRYGESWVDDFLDTGPIYARIDAERMFAFHMPAEAG